MAEETKSSPKEKMMNNNNAKEVNCSKYKVLIQRVLLLKFCVHKIKQQQHLVI